MFKLNYFNGKLSQGFVALFSGRMIQYVGSGLISLFLPIFLLTHFNLRIELVLIYYLVGHLVYAVLLPLGVQFLNRIGLRRSLRISVFFFAAYYVCLFFLEDNVFLFASLSLITLTIARILFWLPYHTDMAKFTDKKDRGKSLSLMWGTASFLGVIMPIISGFLINDYGYNIVFVLAIIIYVCTFIPFLTLPHTRERYIWGYLETFKKYFSRENKKLVLANMANGAENAVGIIIWPIFIWKILEGNFLAVGALSSLIIFFTIILQLSAGKYTDSMDKRKMIHWGSCFYALGWLGKVFVLSSMQIFVVGTYHSFAQIFKDTPFDTLNYELLADQGHYVDEYTVLKEIAVQWGKVIMIVFAIIIALNFGLNWTFALAALASLFINLL